MAQVSTSDMPRPDLPPDLLAAYRRARLQSSAVSPAVLFGARQPMTPAAALAFYGHAGRSTRAQAAAWARPIRLICN